MTTADREDENQEGKHDPGQVNGQCGLAGNELVVGRQQVDDGAGHVNAGQGQQAEENGEKGQDVAGQLPGGLLAPVRVVIREYRDKGGGQRPFPEEITQQVGDAEGHDKGVVGIAGPEHAGKNLFPDQAQDPAAHDGTAHRSRRACYPAGCGAWFIDHFSCVIGSGIQQVIT